MTMSKDIPKAAPFSRPAAGRLTRIHTVRVATVLLGLLALLAAPVYFTGSAQIAPPEATTTLAARNAALVAATQEVLKETSELRQLAVLRPVQSSTQSRPEIERAIMRNLDEGSGWPLRIFNIAR